MKRRAFLKRGGGGVLAGGALAAPAVTRAQGAGEVQSWYRGWA